jgi:ketosteroid isomerase-like protein
MSADGFDEREIRAAERRLEASLSAEDPTAWVHDYTEDAVFDAGHAVQGRAALLEMAGGMHRLSDVSIRALRTEGAPGLATVWCEASWWSGTPATRTDARGILVWRKESDGEWRVALEHIG